MCVWVCVFVVFVWLWIVGLEFGLTVAVAVVFLAPVFGWREQRDLVSWDFRFWKLS